MLDALEKFERDATGATVAVVYYAGHGMSVGKNVHRPDRYGDRCEDKATIRARSTSSSCLRRLGRRLSRS